MNNSIFKKTKQKTQTNKATQPLLNQIGSPNNFKTILGQPPLLRNTVSICRDTTAQNCSQNPFTDCILTQQENKTIKHSRSVEIGLNGELYSQKNDALCDGKSLLSN